MIRQYGFNNFWAGGKFVCKRVVDVRVLVKDNAIWNLGLKLLGDAYNSLLYGSFLKTIWENRTNVTLIRIPFSFIRRAYNLST